MSKLSEAQKEFQRLSIFRVFVGAPFADKRPPDLIGVANARHFSVGPPGSDWKRDGVPLGVIHPEVLSNPDDGTYRNCYALGHLSFISPAERKAIRTYLLEVSGGLCSYCDKPFQFLNCDHVWPAQHGGVTALENLAACCSPCNFCAGRARTGTIWVRRAYVRMRRTGCELDKRGAVPGLVPRFAHLHPDLL
jgi:5-methylcytosine-specific restriction endonuclease McrA